MIYTFEDCELDTRRFELRRSGQPLRLERQVFDLLAYLVQHSDRLVTKEELLDHVWGDRFVSDAALNSRVMTARKAIGDNGREQRLIKTVHGRGYRLAAPVRLDDREGVEAADRPPGEPAAAARVNRVPPLARDEEWGCLMAMFARTAAGQQQIAFLVGEAGIGKTTLLEAFLSEVASAGGVLIGRGQSHHHRGEGDAYLPVFEAFADLCRGSTKDETIALLTRHAPTWVVQMPWLVTPEEHAVLQHRVVGATRERMLREAAEALGALSAQQTVVIALEDLHWVDHSTVDLIGHLARARTSRRLMLAGTYRAHDAQASGHPVHTLVQELSLRGAAEQMTLGPLPESAVESYLRRRFPDSEPQEGIAHLLWERTSGNPLYVTATVDHWAAEGSLTRNNGAIVASPSLEALSRGIPPTLHGLVEQGFAQLDDDRRLVLEAASVAGPQFAAAECAAATGAALEDADMLLAALARLGQFLESAGDEEWRDGTVSGRYRFRHEFYQEVLYQRLPAARRAQLHRAIGHRLESAYGAMAGEIAPRLAMHFRRGRDDEKARHYLQVAADAALSRAGHEEAIGLLRTALELVERLPDSADRDREEAALLTKLATSLVATVGWAGPEVERSYNRAYDLAQRSGDPSLISAITYAGAGFYELRGDYAKSRSLISKRLELQEKEETPDRVDSYEMLACSEFHQGMFDSALDNADRGLALYQPDHHSPLAVYGDHPGVACHDWAALSLWFLGHPDRALDRARQAVVLAEDPYNFYSLANARVQFAIVYQLRREAVTCKTWADATVSLSLRYGYSYRTAMGMIIGGWARAVLGETEDGIRRIHEGIALAQATGAELDKAYFLALLAESQLVSGTPELTVSTVEEALGGIPAGRAFFYEPELHRLRGQAVLASSGDASVGGRAFQTALEVARTQGSRALELRSLVALASLPDGDPERSQSLAELAETYSQFHEGLDTPDLLDARALLKQHGLFG